MFLLDSLMISGIRWVLNTVTTAAEAELNDDSVLREQLLEAEMRREIGEISDEEFAETEADLLGRIRGIKERREGGSGALAFGGGQPIETSPDSIFQIEASVSGDFHEPARSEPERSEAERPERSRGAARADRSEGEPRTAAAVRANARTSRAPRRPGPTRTSDS